MATVENNDVVQDNSQRPKAQGRNLGWDSDELLALAKGAYMARRRFAQTMFTMAAEDKARTVPMPPNSESDDNMIADCPLWWVTVHKIFEPSKNTKFTPPNNVSPQGRNV